MSGRDGFQRPTGAPTLRIPRVWRPRRGGQSREPVSHQATIRIHDRAGARRQPSGGFAPNASCDSADESLCAAPLWRKLASRRSRSRCQAASSTGASSSTWGSACTLVLPRKVEVRPRPAEAPPRIGTPPTSAIPTMTAPTKPTICAVAEATSAKHDECSEHSQCDDPQPTQTEPHGSPLGRSTKEPKPTYRNPRIDSAPEQDGARRLSSGRTLSSFGVTLAASIAALSGCGSSSSQSQKRPCRRIRVPSEGCESTCARARPDVLRVSATASLWAPSIRRRVSSSPSPTRQTRISA